MAFQINGSDVIGTARSYTSTANVSVTDSIIIANNDSLDAVSGSAARYTFSDVTVVIGEDGLGLNDITLRDASIVIAPLISQAQGTVSGYVSGGVTGTPCPTNTNVIQKFSFTSDGNATDVGDLTVTRNGVAGTSSSASGYSSGGHGAVNTIDKFPFATDGNATDVGDLTVARWKPAGQSSTESGYTSGGRIPPTPGGSNTIDKFPFAADGNATDVGDLTLGRYGSDNGQSSEVSGYTSGGSPWPVVSITIDKFPFAADANATDVGDLTNGRYNTTGQNSLVSGYSSGGGQPANINVIDKFPFATDANATDVGDLTQGGFAKSGQSSDASGYSSGGFHPTIAGTRTNVIDKFPFAADANATDVGDLTQLSADAAGQQV